MPDMLATSNMAADAAGIPRLLLLACGIAESSLNPNARRPPKPSQDEAYWTDVSFGAWQQTVRWASEYTGGAAFPGVDEIERVGALYLDPEHAASVAARQLKAHYRPTESDPIATALARYNWPAGNGTFKGAAQEQNYRRGMAEAERLLAQTPTSSVSPPPATADPWTRTQLTNGSAVSTPAEWPTSNPRPIRSLVWHDMEGYLAGAIATWNQGAASAHLCVLRSGEIVRTVEIENIAWHAGTNAATGRTAFWKANNINPVSIGVELEGFVASGYTREQLDACVRIGRWAQAKYGIRPVRGGDSLDGHHLHGEISNQRSDPGPLFPFDAILDSIKGGATVPDTYIVGQGIRDAMAANGDAPASDELQFKRGDKDEWAEAFGRSGTRYVYVASLNRTFRFDPAA